MRTLLLVALICFFLLGCNREEPAPRVYNFASIENMIVDSLWNFNKNIYVLAKTADKELIRYEFLITGDERRLLYSATKWLSAATIMTLVDEQRLSLDDSVGKFLPRFTQYGKGKITIRQLLSHTSGLSSYSRFESNNSITLAQAADSIARVVPLRYAPGTAFNYGDVAMQVAGRVAEIASGKSWTTLFKDKIATPCQLTNTYYNRNLNPGIATGGVSSSNDYVQFLLMLLNKGKVNNQQVLSEKAIELMEQNVSQQASIIYTPYLYNPYTPIGRIQPLQYGVGLWRDVLDATGKAIEFSSPGVNGVHPWIDRKHQVAGIIFTDATFAKTWNTSLKIREIIRKEID